MRIIGPKSSSRVQVIVFAPIFHINKSDVVVANADARWCHFYFRRNKNSQGVSLHLGRQRSA